jgi:ribonucleotide reductase alpha subunit
MSAWLSGLKTLYYYRSKKIFDVDKVNHQSTKYVSRLQDADTCTFCEG